MDEKTIGITQVLNNLKSTFAAISEVFTQTFDEFKKNNQKTAKNTDSWEEKTKELIKPEAIRDEISKDYAQLSATTSQENNTLQNSMEPIMQLHVKLQQMNSLVNASIKLSTALCEKQGK